MGVSAAADDIAVSRSTSLKRKLGLSNIVVAIEAKHISPLLFIFTLPSASKLISPPDLRLIGAVGCFVIRFISLSLP